MTKRFRSLAALACLISAGCVSPDVNPPSPKATTGYVDFYTDSSMGLSWRIKRGNGPDGEMAQVFSDYSPLMGNVLRLATRAGTNEFEVWFYNQFTTGPEIVSVQVLNSQVTPVHVKLVPAGSSTVRTESYQYKQTRRGVRQVLTSDTEGHQYFDIDLSAAPPQDYRRKEQMPYFLSATK